MKPKLLRLLLLPAIMCTLLAVSSFTTAGSAHAATQQPHVIPFDLIHRSSCINDPVEIWTDYNSSTGTSDLDCFIGYGGMPVGLYSVQALYTGMYIFTWTWIDCHGYTHNSQKGPHTQVTATNSPGLFGGCYTMTKITQIQSEIP